MGHIVTAAVSYDGEPRVQPDIISEHYTQVDGLEVIARELATSPHPRWGDKHPAVHHFVTRLLLIDGTERFECNHCHLTDPALKSITAHLTRHRPNPVQPLTDVETIKTVLREVERARRLYGVGRYGKYAAEALTRLGVRPAHGGEWTSQAVSSLYNTYKNKYPVRAPKVQPRPKSKRVAAAKAAAHTDNGVVAPPIESMLPIQVGTGAGLVDRISVALRDAELLIHQAMRDLADLETAADPILLEKARKYDELKGLLG